MNNQESKKIKPQVKLRYWVDNSLSKRGAFVAYVALAVIALAAAIAVLQVILGSIAWLNVPKSEAANAFESFWFALTKTLSLGGAETAADRIMSVVYWFVGLAVSGSVIALRANTLAKTLEKLKAARSPILDSGHILILGWSPRIFTILKELDLANANVRKPLVVIFAAKERKYMDDELAARAGELQHLRVITRKGDTTNPEDLKRANVAGAKVLIVLDSDRSGDSMIVSTVLAARSISGKPNQRIIAEVDDANIAETLEESTGGAVVAVIPSAVIAKVTAQASRQPGIPAVILELLDFAGDEIYFTEVPALVGKTYFEAQMAFNKAALLGVVPFGKTPVLNPAHSYKMAAGDRVMAIAADDDQVTYTGILEDVKRPATKRASASKPKPRNILVMGWSTMGRAVLTELAAFLPAGSTADIVSHEKFVEPELLEATKFGALKVKHVRSTGNFEQLAGLVKAKKYDEVLVLGYRGELISEAEADGQTLLATMQLSRLFNQQLAEGTAPRLVAEILDPLKAELAQTSSVDDLVVSENLAALLVAQLSENPELASIFSDLFNSTKGSAVHVRPIDAYAKLGKSVSFAQLVAVASSMGETAIGWRARDPEGVARIVNINPAKDAVLVPFEGDGLIVIGKSS